MVNYKRMIQENRNKRLTEDDDIEDIVLSDRLYDIANDLGYTFTLSKNNSNEGVISISDYLSIVIRFADDEIKRIFIRTYIDNSRIDCTRNTTTADNISIELQTCVLIIKDIKQKLM